MKALPMIDAVYRKIEIVGTSSTSLEDAIENAVSRACRTLRHVQWFEVKEHRGYVEDGEVKSWQVILDLAFRLEEDDDDDDDDDDEDEEDE